MEGMTARDPHLLVEELFLAAGHDVASEVGPEPGTLVRTARPREGLVRPKIAWVVWKEWPAGLDEAFAVLERLREGAGADRAIGMVDGLLPEGQAGAVKRGVLDVMTVRRFGFELANVEEHLAELRTSFEKQLGEAFIPRVVELEDDRRMDGVSAVLEWCKSAAPEDALWIVGPQGSGRSTMVNAAAASLAERFQETPDRTRPVLSLAIYRRPSLARLLRDVGWVILSDTGREEADEPGWPGCILKQARFAKEELPAESRDRSTVYRLVELHAPEVAAWLEMLLPARAAALRRLVVTIPDFGSLLVAPRSLSLWVRVVKDSWPQDAATDAKVGEGLGWSPFNSLRNKFQNTLLRDYFLAHKIIADVRAGRREILSRYQFPREFVLLFVAILSPEVAALASEDRSKVMHDEIAAEVEREVQLTSTGR